MVYLWWYEDSSIFPCLNWRKLWWPFADSGLKACRWCAISSAFSHSICNRLCVLSLPSEFIPLAQGFCSSFASIFLVFRLSYHVKLGIQKGKILYAGVASSIGDLITKVPFSYVKLTSNPVRVSICFSHTFILSYYKSVRDTRTRQHFLSFVEAGPSNWTLSVCLEIWLFMSFVTGNKDWRQLFHWLKHHICFLHYELTSLDLRAITQWSFLLEWRFIWQYLDGCSIDIHLLTMVSPLAAASYFQSKVASFDRFSIKMSFQLLQDYLMSFIFAFT